MDIHTIIMVLLYRGGIMKFENKIDGTISFDAPEINTLLCFVGNGISTVYNDFFGIKRRIKNFKIAGDLELSYSDNKWSLSKPLNKCNFVERKEFIKVRNSIEILEATVQKILLDVESGKELEYTPPENDWSTIFLENSQYVSDEKLRDIWSSLLKEEMTGQQKNSKKTLEILKSINLDEILVIEKIFQYVITLIVVVDSKEYIGGYFLHCFNSDEELREVECDFSYVQLRRLSNMGLMYTSTINHNIKEPDYFIKINSVKLLKQDDDHTTIPTKNSNKKTFSGWELTKEGLYLYRIIKDTIGNPPEKYINLLKSRYQLE